MTNPEVVTEQTRMKWPEKLLRGIGGYTLGFTGMVFEVGGVATLNPLSTGVGAGLVYVGHRVLEPLHDLGYGEHQDSLPKWRRALRFNASLLPTFIGANLLGGALFGAEVNGANLNAGERIVTGAIGVPVLLAGGIYERHLHLGGSIAPGVMKSPTENPDGNHRSFSESFRSGFSSGRTRATA